MARNKTQPKIEGFIKELSKLSQTYGMIIDVNGGGKASLEITDSRYLEGAPLVLYARSGDNNNYRKVGYLYYAFLGEEEIVAYHFEPAKGMPYTSVELTEEDLDIKKKTTEVPSPMVDAINKAKAWSSSIEIPKILD